MIGKPEWFTYRIFGWGVRPKTKEGYIYILVWIAVIAAIAALPLEEMLRALLFVVALVVIVIDTMHIMMQLPKVHDERENLQQLIIERNCSFAAIFALVAVLFVQLYMNQWFMDINVVWPIFVVLGVMLLTKIISIIYVHKAM